MRHAMLNGPFSFGSGSSARLPDPMQNVRVWSMRKLLFAGFSVVSLLAVPAESFARDHRGDWGGRDWHERDWRYDGRHYSHRHRHDRGDAVAAGIIGLALGAAIGVAITEDRDRYRGGPPRAYDRYNEGPYYHDDGYYRDDGYRKGGYYPQGQCFRRELVWDPRTRRNIEVTHPYPC
jgi:hypothetical protein